MNYYNSIANIKIAPNHSAPLIYILQLKYGELMTLFSSAYIVHHAIVIVIVRYTCYSGCVYQLVKGKIRAGLSLKRQVCNAPHCSFKTPTYPNFLICITLNTTFILTRDRF